MITGGCPPEPARIGSVVDARDIRLFDREDGDTQGQRRQSGRAAYLCAAVVQSARPHLPLVVRSEWMLGTT
jgi:hypothetical protein